MTNRTFHWMIAAALVAGAGACSREEPQTTTAAPPATAAEQPAQRDDSWITTAVQAKYYATDDVRGRNVSVVSRDGVVTLRGEVESDNAKQRAVALAREVEGVKNVQDYLVVQTAATSPDPRGPNAAAQPTGTSGRDESAEPAWITTKIQAQYFINPEIKPWNIDVTTSNEGVVTLEGEVDAADDKAEAVRIARATDNVTRVDDRLRIKGQPNTADATPATGIERPDVWLTAKIQSKYFLDDEVKGHEINVETNNAVVTLNGTIENEAQRRQAIAIARSTEGVKDVVDRLQVSPERGTTATREGRELTPVRGLDRPDAWITMKVQSKYFLDRTVKGAQIDVDTSKGVVTLKGTVTSSEQKQQAEQIARETEGARRVVNQLTVKG